MALDRADLERLARAHIAAENAGDVAAVLRTVNPAGGYYHMVSSGEILRTRAEIQRFYESFLLPLPDLVLEIDRMVVDVERRQVVSEYRLSGTHRGWFWGLAPTQRRVAWRGVVLYEFDAESTLVREISYFDKTEILESLGLIANTKTNLGRLLLLLGQSPLYALRCAIGALRGSATSTPAT